MVRQKKHRRHMDNPHSVSNRRKMRSRIVMIVHDAIWVEASEEEPGQAKELMRYHMRNPCPGQNRIACHGLQRIWEYLDLPEFSAVPGFIDDTMLMAYLLDPDSGEQESYLTLAYLVDQPASTLAIPKRNSEKGQRWISVLFSVALAVQ